jgi:hypothetical protein
VLGLYILKENYIHMKTITLAQREALDVVKDMIDKSNPDVPEYGTKIMTLILGILNIDCRVEHTITQIDGDKIAPIITPGTGNDRLQINIPNIPGVQIFPGEISHPEPAPYPPQVWYNQEPEPIQTNKQEDINYVTEVTHTGDKNGIVYVSNTADVRYNGDKNCVTTTRNPNDCVTYTGDFSDEQTSFNDK